VGDATALLLKVHPSNFRLEGFTHTPSLGELVELGHAKGLLVMEDLGSGLLFDGPIEGLEHEPRVRASVATGADLITFSGDKLMGSVQAGIALGRAACVSRLRADALYRALRLDKLSLAALEATLAVYRDGNPLSEIPVLARLSCPPAAVKARAERLRVASADRLGRGAAPLLAVEPSQSFAGSGANPARPIPSFALAFATRAPDRIAEALRLCSPAVFARVHEGRLLLDARTLSDEEIDLAAAALAAAVDEVEAHA
jgi:L-seryl-tRNA(Ser) seleniumtransferase